MTRCEDHPCCGHGDNCPSFDMSGHQLDMMCVCGAAVPIESAASICDSCLTAEGDGYGWDEDDMHDTNWEGEGD